MLHSLPAPCGICGRPILDPADCDVDHIVPVAHGGTDDLGNLRLTHASCNRGRRVKGAQRPDRPHWRTTYPAHWPLDPDPANTVTDWSRHWATPGVFNPRCSDCRQLGRACIEPDKRDAA